MGKRAVKKGSKAYRVFCYCFSVLVILAGWHITSLILASPALPSPLDTLEVFRDYVPGLMPDLLISLRRVLVSLLIGAVPAIVIALALSRNERIDALFSPMLYIMYPIPKVVILPVLLVLFGLADAPKIVLISLTVFFQVLIAVRDAAKAVPTSHLMTVLSCGGGRVAQLRHVMIPATAPAVLTSLRLSAGTAIAVLFLAEAIAGSTGLGYFIMESWAMVDYPRMFSGIICMALLGIVIYAVIDVVERRIGRWR